MEITERMHGSTSIGLPGICGDRGPRSRIFFYGNINEEYDSSTLCFYTPDSSVEMKEAMLPDGIIPEEYDYIFYTDNEYDTIYAITNIDTEDNRYICEAKEIDRMALEESEQDSTEITTFIVNVVKVNSGFVSRNARNMDIKLYTGTDNYYCYPKTKKEYYSNLFSFTITVPSNSKYTFTSNTKITLEFNTVQSSIMDSTINSKFYQYGTNGYRGHIENYSLYKVYGETSGGSDRGGEQQGQASNQITVVKNNIGFDDERLENFIITIKDFDYGNDSKSVENSMILMTDSLTRCGANPKAYLCVYTKYDDNFIRKSVIGEFPLDFIHNNYQEEMIQQTEMQSQNQNSAS